MKKKQSNYQIIFGNFVMIVYKKSKFLSVWIRDRDSKHFIPSRV
jgi:hypothetical protein